jgi:hypothetical protein
MCTSIARTVARTDEFMIATDYATAVVSKACETKEVQELAAL